MSRGRPHWSPAYIGLGSNLGDSRQILGQAMAEIGALDAVELIARSSLYRSRPLGPQDQPDFLNAVVGVLTTRAPADLLAALRAIEERHGRRRTGERWGPRTLDLDLLVFGRRVIDEPGLTVPHPRIAERNFVLLPLAEIAPHLEVPGLASVGSLAAALDRNDPEIERLEPE